VTLLVNHDVRVLDGPELREAHDLFGSTVLFGPTSDARWPRAEALYAPGRTIGVHEDGALVATATAFPSRMAVPGGAAPPMAAVTRVGVRADRARRGLLAAMMRAQLADVVERGEPLASLRASQARIYGRFGYGVATRGRSVRVRRSGAGWREGAPRGGTVRLVGRADALETLTAVYDRIGLCRPGGMVRTPGWWGNTLGQDLDGGGHLLVAVHTGPAGDDGFAVATVGKADDFERRPLVLEDLHAADLAAAAGLWRFLLGVDLAGAVEGHLRPLDEAVELMLADRRDATVTATGDEAWLRLVDVRVALAARTFPAGLTDPVLVGVHDPLLPANTGVYRIGDGPAERVTARPHLECDVAALAMAYLGDLPPSILAATGWWQVHDSAALARADLLFATPVRPWCGTFF
jgi:predicted acetyltransferase